MLPMTLPNSDQHMACVQQIVLYIPLQEATLPH